MELVDCWSNPEVEELAAAAAAVMVSVIESLFSLSVAVAVAVVVTLVFSEEAESLERDLAERQGNTEKRMVRKVDGGRMCASVGASFERSE